jgi:hypothetical protein
MNSTYNWGPKIGGVVGYASAQAKVSQCYYTGTVILTGNGTIGAGLVLGCGDANNMSNKKGYIEYCWSNGTIIKNNAAQNNPPIGGTDAQISNCHVLSGGDKPAQNAYADWDFSTVWKMGGDGYPHLRWESD